MKHLLHLFLAAGVSALSAQSSLPDPPPQPASQTASLAVPQVDAEGRPFHVVQASDSLFSIAAAYGLSLSQLIDLNAVKNMTIVEGQRLFLAPPGTKFSVPPGVGDKAGAPVPPPAGTPADPESNTATDPSATDFVASGPMDPKPSQMQAQIGIVLTDTKKPSAPPTARPKATVPLHTTIIENQDSNLPEPVNPAYRRSPITGELPAAAPLSQVLTPLPLLDTGNPRSDWTDSQERIARWWERQIVHTLGIPRSTQWLSDIQGNRLVIGISPSSNVRQTIRVIIPGTQLPPEIDGAVLRRLVSIGAPFRVLGHLIYQDGPAPVAAICSGELLSPWGIVAESLEVKSPAEGWISITKPRPTIP